MKQPLSTIRESSRELLETLHPNHPVRPLAAAIWYGAEIISRHHLNDQSPMPCFEQALFRLCQVSGHTLCGQPYCRANRSKACACATETDVSPS